MASALFDEHTRITAAIEQAVARLGVLAAAPLGALVVELWALGSEWEDDREDLVALVEQANAELELVRDETPYGAEETG